MEPELAGTRQRARPSEYKKYQHYGTDIYGKPLQIKKEGIKALCKFFITFCL
jgi:hypothetical protein